VASLDARLLGGGLPAGSMTAVVGSSASGKTTLALQFLSGSSAAEPGLWFGCFESPERLRLRAETMGFDLAGAEGRGEVEILWRPVGEHILDELAHHLLDAGRRRGVKRLVIDGLASFEQAALEPERIGASGPPWPTSCAHSHAGLRDLRDREAVPQYAESDSGGSGRTQHFWGYGDKRPAAAAISSLGLGVVWLLASPRLNRPPPVTKRT
jgi:energy-coupling factor transporter ATP-binding protein EcfA2